MLTEAVKIRRDLHRIPERSEQETETSRYICAYLDSLGVRYKRVGTGVYATIKGAKGNGTIGLRADIDALPIVERSGEAFASVNGAMHACGHDGHTTILLCLAKLLTENKPARDVRLIFQFGEEGAGGAEKMIEGGALRGVDEIYAFHLCPELEKGAFASAEGALFAGAVEFDVAFTGRAAHCADPEKGADALLAASSFVAELQDIIAPFRGNALIHAGRLTGGEARNIVADRAEVECTFRYFDVNDRERMAMRTEDKLVAISNRTGADHTLTVRCVYEPLIVSAYALSKFRTVAQVVPCAPRYTAEDFSAYCMRVPGCLVWLGIRDEKYRSPLHSDTFGFDETALLYGIEAFYKLVNAI